MDRKTGKGPWAAAVITNGVASGAVRKAVSAGAGMLEARVDTFASLKTEVLVQSFLKLKKIAGLPILLTIRSGAEGGLNSIPDEKRAELFNALIPYSDLVDIELGSSGILKYVVESAKRKRKKVVVSYHDFKSTPGDKKLNKIIESGLSAGGDIVKIAAFVNSRNDLRRLAGLLARGERLAIIGMGPKGAASRVFFPLLGSMITYGSVTDSTAPGQMRMRELAKELRRYGF